MRASKLRCSAVAVAAILRLFSSPVASSHVVQPHSADGIIDGPAMCRLIGRSCNLFLRCAVTTAEPPQLRYAYCTPPTAGQLSVEHLSAIFTRRSDLRRVICTARVLRAGLSSRRAWSCATQERPLFTTVAGTPTRSRTRCMQKDRPRFVKVRQGTATERAPSLCAAARIACVMARTLTVRLRLCAA